MTQIKTQPPSAKFAIALDIFLKKAIGIQEASQPGIDQTQTCLTAEEWLIQEHLDQNLVSGYWILDFYSTW